MDLVINVVYIFFAFSNFSSFHKCLTQYKVGDMVMRVIELELKRDAHRKEELEKKRKVRLDDLRLVDLESLEHRASSDDGFISVSLY